MKITSEDVKYIAKLAKLNFSDEEVLRLTNEFESILTNFQSLDNMNLDNVNLNEFNENQKSVVRTDSEIRFEDKKKLFRNVKTMRGAFIQVPKIIE